MLKPKRIFLFLFLTLSALPAFSQVDTAWVRKLTDSRFEPVYGAGRLLAVDKAGNVYTSGVIKPSNGTRIIKYNSCGDTVWVKSPPYMRIPRTLLFDDSGNVYLTGQDLNASYYNYFTLKYSPNGDTLWTRRYTGPNNLDDNPTDMVVDKNRNVIVTGSSPGATGNLDYATVKYAPNGDTVWVRRFDSGMGNPGDAAHAVVVDTFGNVCVTGFAGTVSTNFEWRTIKYSPSGTVLWSKIADEPVTSTDYPTDMAVDAQGNIFVCGSSGKVGSGPNFATIKYAPNGDTLWVRHYRTPGDSSLGAAAMEVDQSGNVYVAGYADNNYLTIKYAPNGDTVWVRRYNGPANFADLANALAVDVAGNAYVTGVSYNGTSYDYFTIMYAPNGDTVWTRKYSGGIETNAVKVDTAGNVYVAGNSGNVSSPDLTVIKYSSDPPCPPHYSANTPAGNGVYIQPYPGMGILFKHVSSPGITTVTLNPTGPAPPSSFTLLPTNPPVYYDIQTTATYSDSVYVCLFYSDSAVVANEDSLRILHYNGSTWQDVTVFKDVNVNDICGGATSLSPFALAIPGSSCAAIPGDVNASGAITIGDIIHLVNYIFDKDKLPCLGTDPGNCWTPDPFCRGDANQTGTITIGDIVHLVNYIFDKDRLPCLGSDPGNCWTPEASGACCLQVP